MKYQDNKHNRVYFISWYKYAILHRDFMGFEGKVLFHFLTNNTVFLHLQIMMSVSNNKKLFYCQI